MAEENPYRLPSDVRPTHYDLTVKTDLEELAFQGFVRIRYVFIPIVAIPAFLILSQAWMSNPILQR
jgi:hypothetical protein